MLLSNLWLILKKEKYGFDEIQFIKKDSTHVIFCAIHDELNTDGKAVVFFYLNEVKDVNINDKASKI